MRQGGMVQVSGAGPQLELPQPPAIGSGFRAVLFAVTDAVDFRIFVLAGIWPPETAYPTSVRVFVFMFLHLLLRFVLHLGPHLVVLFLLIRIQQRANLMDRGLVDFLGFRPHVLVR